ncbi:transglutaminase family protein [Mangrovimicrobium sediminis]|uniref:Transglutaminase family protein n=1 Tax=Mangrovimicrobium sediminis TaxID=2562682 RepID=A0A4Z0M492_9GAMM|nr:transglutaminase family protein [Haliea sp. SAOS-164]TGD74260.1 transglutaminase family protein [Haliea sp. SAOS-164]
MWLRASTRLQFDAKVDTPFILMLRPRSGWQQWVGREHYALAPSVPVVEFTDAFGNLCQRLVAPAGPFSILASADVECPPYVDAAPGAPFVEVQSLPEDVLPFLLPSRYCESDCFYQMAFELTEGCLPGWDQVNAIVEYVARTIRYTPGSGTLLRSAREVNGCADAVCRDLSHLSIALTRALSIPARMVVGYLEPLTPMDLHAWFEAFVGGRWYTFDPTQKNLNGGRVAVAYGRDAADVAIFTQFGDPVPLVSMEVNVQQTSAPPY